MQKVKVSGSSHIQKMLSADSRRNKCKTLIAFVKEWHCETLFMTELKKKGYEHVAKLMAMDPKEIQRKYNRLNFYQHT